MSPVSSSCQRRPGTGVGPLAQRDNARSVTPARRSRAGAPIGASPHRLRLAFELLTVVGRSHQRNVPAAVIRSVVQDDGDAVQSL
jgi:hypothetical protein